MALSDLPRLIQNSGVALAIQDSAYAYPLIEGSHVLSLTLSVGLIIWFDLRLVGLILRGRSIKGMYASLQPWLMLGFSLMAITGLLLFSTRATDIWASNLFRLKLVLLAICGLNIAAYHFVVERNNVEWDRSNIPPMSARIAGGLSLVLWFTVVAVGRIMAYGL